MYLQERLFTMTDVESQKLKPHVWTRQQEVLTRLNPLSTQEHEAGPEPKSVLKITHQDH